MLPTMPPLVITPFALAQRFIGIAEVPGSAANPQILAMLKLDGDWPQDDAVPWCSAFVNYICWLLRLPRSKSLRARSWLLVGTPITAPEPGFDVVILNRGGPQDPAVIEAPGHVGFFAGWEGSNVLLVGGNQGDRVSLSRYPTTQVLGLRRIR